MPDNSVLCLSLQVYPSPVCTRGLLTLGRLLVRTSSSLMSENWLVVPIIVAANPSGGSAVCFLVGHQ